MLLFLLVKFSLSREVKTQQLVLQSAAQPSDEGKGVIGERLTGQHFASHDDFADIARHGIVEVVGDDAAGRKIIVVSACRLPCNKGFDHQRFLR